MVALRRRIGQVFARLPGKIESRILIIDDEAELRAMLRRMLEQEGHEVTETANDAQGLRLYEQDASDLIITDIIMPEREGVETVIALRRADPELPIIAISGGGRPRTS